MAILLKKGTRDPRVTEWQNFLRSQGYLQVAATGEFDELTDAATRAFQRDAGLRDDGIVGDNTIAAAREKGFLAGPAPSKGSADKLSAVHPSLRAKVLALIDLAAKEGFTLTVTQGLRTFDEQDELYAIGRSRPGKKVTNAKGGQSNHNYGLAADLAFLVNGKVSWDDKLYPNIGRWAKEVGLAWGGNWKFKDLPHVELPGLPKWKALLDVYRAGGISKVWEKYG